MGLVTKVEPIARDIELLVRNDLRPAARSAAVADYARDAFAAADAANQRILGRKAPSTVTVDGRAGAALDSVRPDGGTIIFEWELVTDVLKWIGDTLVERSPVISGAYRRGHTLFADGAEVAIGDDIPPATEYVFTNLVPYARKIEFGKTESGRAFVIQVDDHIYERTAKDAQRRFGNIAKVKYDTRAIPAGAVGAWAKTASARRHAALRRGGNPAGHTDWLTRQPAIVVTLPKGLT